jgi:hypothetical protein
MEIYEGLAEKVRLGAISYLGMRVYIEYRTLPPFIALSVNGEKLTVSPEKGGGFPAIRDWHTRRGSISVPEVCSTGGSYATEEGDAYSCGEASYAKRVRRT